MIKYPTIISSTQEEPSSITICLFIPKGIVFFQGHFPQMPILPGIAQIDWVLFFARKFFQISAKICPTIEQIKFTNIIKPEATIFLSLKLAIATLTFKYFADDIIYSLGKIKI